MARLHLLPSTLRAILIVAVLMAATAATATIAATATAATTAATTTANTASGPSTPTSPAGQRSPIAHEARHRRHTHASCVATARRHHRSHPRARCDAAHEHHRRHRAHRHAKRATAPSTPRIATSKQATTPPSLSPTATIADILATPCQDTQALPTPQNIEAIRTSTVCLINQERARNGEQPLRSNASLDRAGQQHSEEMLAADYFSHVAPDGETPLQRITDAGYLPNAEVGYAIGENIAWGTLELATPSAIVAAWIASPDHLANILDRQYVETGVGVAPSAPASMSEGQPGGIYSQEFGAIIR